MHADGHRDSMKESAKGRFFENKFCLLRKLVTGVVCITTLTVKTTTKKTTTTKTTKANIVFGFFVKSAIIRTL